MAVMRGSKGEGGSRNFSDYLTATSRGTMPKLQNTARDIKRERETCRMRKLARADFPAGAAEIGN